MSGDIFVAMGEREVRNPSPPKEFEDDAEKFRQDLIGNTTISKKWVYTILVQVCTEADRQQKDSESDILDLAEDVQDDLCRLWDLCMEQDVANFLVDSDAIELLCKVLSASKSPRLTEIIVGILGNMACSNKACEALSQSLEAILVIVSLFSCRDSLTLVELGRLVATCLSNTSYKDTWLDFIESNVSNFIEDVTFILSSCSNQSVLKYVLEVVDICLDSRDSILMSFSTIEFSNAVAETGLQLLQSDNTMTSVVNPLHILYLVTAMEDCNTAIFASNITIFQYIAKCCEKWAELDDFSIADHNPSAIPLASCMAIYVTLLESSLSSEDLGKDFLGNIGQPPKQNILTIVDSTLQCFSTNLDVKNEAKQLLPENREESRPTSPENTNDNVDAQDRSDELLNGIVNDLVFTLRKVGWEKSVSTVA